MYIRRENSITGPISSSRSRVYVLKCFKADHRHRIYHCLQLYFPDKLRRLSIIFIIYGPFLCEMTVHMLLFLGLFVSSFFYWVISIFFSYSLV